MANFSPSAIFSPSVARQQLAAARDWNYVDSWLSTKFSGKTPPPFERNNETLKALLALAAANEAADEERELLAKLEAKALQDLQAKEKSDPNAELVDTIEQSLTREGHASIEALSQLGVALKQPTQDVQKLGQAIIDLQVASYDLEQTSERISILEAHLNTELEHINTLIKDLQSDSYQPTSNLGKQAIEYQRKAKVLVAKIPELRDRTSSLATTLGHTKVTIEDVKSEEDKYKALMVTVKDLERRVKSYHGLPQDTDLARLELERLRMEIRDLTHERDSMFEGLVERESPQKRRS